MKKSFILIILGIVLYSFSLFNGFVWDDEVVLQQNPSVMNDSHSLLNQVYFRPGITAVYSSLYTLFGPHPFVFHSIQVIFHILTALLIFFLFRRFLKENIAFYLSLIFLVHPANVEAVCFASALQEVLFTFLGIVGLYLLVRAKNISVVNIFISTILITGALLMKETAIMFFPLLLCYVFLFHRKNTMSMQFLVLFGIVAVFTYGMARFSSGNTYFSGYGLFPIMRVSQAVRFMNIPLIILYYLGTFFVPIRLGIAQHWVVHSMNFSLFFLPLIAEIILVFAALFYIKKTNNKTFTFFFIWFLLGLLPHIQLIPLNMTVAERWLYFSQIGILGMVGSLNLKFKIGGGLVILLLFIISFMRTLNWHDGLALYSHDITSTSSFDLQNNLGVELFRVGRFSEAKKYFEISTRLAPYWWVNWNNLGAVYQHENNLQMAQKCYEKATQNGDYLLAYENLAKILVLQGKDTHRAQEFLKKALSLFPESETLQNLQLYMQKK